MMQRFHVPTSILARLFVTCGYIVCIYMVKAEHRLL